METAHLTAPFWGNTERPPLPPAVIRRAENLLRAAHAQQTAAEQRLAAGIAGMMNDAAGKAFTLAMVDQVFRSQSPAKQAARWRRVLRQFGAPKYLPLVDRALLNAGGAASALAPGVVMPLVADRLRADSSHVILNANPARLAAHLDQRREQGFRINLNHLGEAVLGEEEARRRFETLLEYLANPRVDYVSVKISAIFSQVNVIAWDASVRAIAERLRVLYRAAAPQRKFVNLDMEEYRDLALTLETFQKVLDEPEFRSFSAGIVLQAYLPDSFAAQQTLTAWAKQRVARGGAEIKVRLVKGANLAMEKVEAELHGWNPAPYATKAETDANYRRMLEFGCRPENAAAVRLGVATHNLFDVALALELRERFGVEDRVELEMLEGMANHQARAVRDAAGGLLLYSPVVADEDFFSAMSYLVRRLDENTAPENFLRSAFHLQPGTPEWEEQRQRFENGWRERETVGSASRRALPSVDPRATTPFANQPDSDWTQPAVRAALQTALQHWTPPPVPPAGDLNDTLNRAVAAQVGWNDLGVAQRRDILRAAADTMQCARFDTIACMQREAKKAVAEADAEVSEAVDFARYYAEVFAIPEGLHAKPLGVVVITPPWNFPYAIPAGGVLAALIAGNSVILKPAPETVTTAYLIAEQLWRAGVPRDVLQFFPCADGDVGRALITDPRTAAVVLTGAYETANLFRSWRPALPLFAETSGKNALVITAQADRDLAIKDLVKSAFGHSGQKCSAASLAIVEAEVYDDPSFRRQLRDAAASLPVGPAGDLRSVVTPLIRAASPALQRALTQLDPGEEWLLEPRQDQHDPCLWSPGIKLGVHPGSWFHQTECFGPVLGVMRANSLAQAIEFQNAPAYGLTAGLHSLDVAEQQRWREQVQAGNLYINRATTGAIVQRQPFGGWKRSSIGPGAKAGGPNYPLLFTRLGDAVETSPAEVEASYRRAWGEHFTQEHDPSTLACESNVFRYRPCRGVILRIDADDRQSIERAQLAARITGVTLHLSTSVEPEADFLARLPELAAHAEFLRTTVAPSAAVLQTAAACDLNWIDAPFTANGRCELRYWLREQSVSRTKHRYGLPTD